MLGWGRRFIQLIGEIRLCEFAALRKFAYLNAFQRSFYEAVPLIVSLVTFMAYLYQGRDLEIELVFPTLLLFQLLRFPLGVFPSSLSSLLASRISSQRIDDFLKMPEVPSARQHSSLDDVVPLTPKPSEHDIVVRLENVSLGWDKDAAPVLEGIELQLARGELLMVVGAVGSGKSTLVSGLLHNAECTGGSIHIDGSCAYVPQEVCCIGTPSHGL